MRWKHSSPLRVVTGSPGQEASLNLPLIHQCFLLLCEYTYGLATLRQLSGACQSWDSAYLL